MGIAYSKTDTSLSIVIDFRPVIIPSSHPNFDELVEAVRDPDTEVSDIRDLIDIPKAIDTFTGGNVTVINGRLFYKGFEVKSKLASIILNLVRDGKREAARPFELFMEKAFANPDPRAAMDLFEWVAASNLPITPEGDILAWKAVRADYNSIHSGPRGHLRHKIGDVVEEPREETDGDPTRTCSRGIHFASIDYLKHGYIGGGNRIMAVAISPTDVVAFPKDYGNSKGRACRLTVVGEVPNDQVPTYYPQGQRIYDGWNTKADAVPARRHKVGERWLDGVGDLWEVTSVNSQTTRAVLVRLNGLKVDGRELQFSTATGQGVDNGYKLVRRA